MYRFQKFEQPVILENHLHLGGSNPNGERIDVNSSYFTRGGKPWSPIMGEFHFSRYDRAFWYEELCKMKAGGITLVSTYLFWLYHEETEGQLDFTGDNDIRAFVQACGKAGLEVVLRIGPWAHGECRNGGFPDWLLKKPFPLRQDNEGYLALVRRWYEGIAKEVQGLFYKDGGNIVAVQVENEFTDDAGHLATLKRMAIECGMDAPLFTVTGWNSAAGAKIPVDEVAPVFGGYCDAPWDGGTDKLPPSIHYFFNRMRNDSAIGADLLAESEGDGWRLPYERYPFATCELGGGLESTHHRRYIIRGMDIYALSLVKLGDGNNLAGYYMYHGGTNKLGRLSTFQESRATGYPNDYPILSYDFQAPLSEYGEVREHYRLLNLLHLFIQDFQEVFAPMTAVDAEEKVSREDTVSLRYGMRTDGKSGFVFVNHYQRSCALEDVLGAVIDTGSLVFPPIDVCGEVSFFLPFGMALQGRQTAPEGGCNRQALEAAQEGGRNGQEAEIASGITLEYATAQPVCRQGSVYFFVEIPGIRAEYHFTDGRHFAAEAGLESRIEADGVTIVTLTLEQARFLRRLDGALYIGESCDLYSCDGRVRCVQDGIFEYLRFDGEGFVRESAGREVTPAVLTKEPVERPPFEPKYPEELQIGGARRVTWYRLTVTGKEGFVSINTPCDVSQIYADGELVADNYYCGLPWRVPAALLEGRACYLALSEMKDDFYREF